MMHMLTLRLKTSIALYALTVAQIACSPIREEEGKRLEFVFITTCVDEDFFDPVKKGMRDAADLMGVECAFTGTPGVDARGQAEMVREAIGRGVDGIALNIIDSVAFDGVIGESLARGIPVVAFNGDDSRSPNGRLSSVCQNLYLAGKQLGEALSGQIPDGSRVVVTVHSAGISALEERVRGIRDGLRGKDLSFETVITTNTVDSAERAITDALRRNPGVEAVLCTGLADTEAMGNVLEKGIEGRGIKAAGFDLSPAILRHVEAGTLLFTIDQQPYMQGFLPVIQLALYRRYGILPSDNEIGAVFVTEDNVAQVRDLTVNGYR